MACRCRPERERGAWAGGAALIAAIALLHFALAILTTQSVSPDYVLFWAPKSVHFALAASFFTDVHVVGPVGDDFGEDQVEVLASRGVDVGDIDVELDLVPVRILDVQTVGDRVIRGTDEAGTRRHQLVSRLPQLRVGVADLEPEVIHPDSATLRDRHRVLPHLDQEQLVVRPAG